MRGRVDVTRAVMLPMAWLPYVFSTVPAPESGDPEMLRRWRDRDDFNTGRWRSLRYAELHGYGRRLRRGPVFRVIDPSSPFVLPRRAHQDVARPRLNPATRYPVV